MTRQERHIQQFIDELMHLSTAPSFPGKTHLMYETIRLLHEAWNKRDEADNETDV